MKENLAAVVLTKQFKMSTHILKVNNLFVENAKYFAESGLPGLSLLECLDEHIKFQEILEPKNMEKIIFLRKRLNEPNLEKKNWEERKGKWIGLPFSVLPTRQSAPLLPHLMLMLAFTIFVGQTSEYTYI